MTERLHRLTEVELDDAQRELFRAITGGPRVQGTQHFALQGNDGALNGPFGVMLHAPRVCAALQELGAAIRYRTSLTDRAREIAILAVAVATDSEFEWYAHERVGRAAGLTDEELAGLRSRSFASADAAENAVVFLCDRLLRGGELDDDDYAHVTDVLGEQQVLEVTVLVGYYRTLAQMMSVFGICAPDAQEFRA